ncbi:MAG: helical backbone metal receptor [Kiritimatiellia bacterium]|nr:helical backbone metal receptor [Kiritimatiellia bacterium]
MRIKPQKIFPLRDCPGCAMSVPANENRCPVCGYEFPGARRPARIYIVLSGLVALALLTLWIGPCRFPSQPEPLSPLQPAIPARRVISLAPNLTEIVFAIGAGDRLVGRTSACDTPDEARSIPVVGGFGRPSLERVIQMRADLVLDVDLEDEQMAMAIRNAGIPMERIPCRKVDDIPAAIRRIGFLLGETDAAEALATQIEQEFAKRRARPNTAYRPRVYAEIWPDPPMTIGHGSFVAELIQLAGGINVAREVGREYFPVSTETVLKWNPDILLLLYMAQSSSPAERLAARPGWRDLSALRSGRIIAHLDPALFLRPGPRVLEGIRQLETALQNAAQNDTK